MQVLPNHLASPPCDLPRQKAGLCLATAHLARDDREKQHFVNDKCVQVSAASRGGKDDQRGSQVKCKPKSFAELVSVDALAYVECGLSISDQDSGRCEKSVSCEEFPSIAGAGWLIANQFWLT